MSSLCRWTIRVAPLSRLTRPAFATGVAILLSLSIVSAQIARAAAGDLDPSFGTGGRVTTDFGGGESAHALVIQSDGKLVAGGSTSTVERNEGPGPPFQAKGADFALARYNWDGSLDREFGVDGKVMTDFGGDDQLVALIVQPDGDLVGAGSTRTPAHVTDSIWVPEGDADFAIARYRPDGTPDASFGLDGHVVTDLGGSDEVAALALQSDGKLVLAGSSRLPDGAPGTSPNMRDWQRTAFALARYDADGSLDRTFGDGGKAITRLSGGGGWLSSVVILADGRIMVAGSVRASAIGVPQQTNASLARYTADGVPDASFGVDGISTIESPSDSSAYAVLLQPDGNLVMGVNGIPGTALIRYNTDGTADPTFRARTLVGGGFGKTLGIQDDGKLLVAGGAQVSTAVTAPVPALEPTQFALCRYNIDGSIDESFGTGGIVTTSYGEHGFVRPELAQALVVQQDGRIVAAGLATRDVDGGTDLDFGLVRYEAR